MKYKYLILFILFLFPCTNDILAENEVSFSDDSLAPWESSRLTREEKGRDFAVQWVKERLERAGYEKNQPGKIYLDIQKMAPEELVEQETGHWASAQVVMWREMKKFLEKGGNLLTNDLSMEMLELERFYKEVISDRKITPYESFAFSWYAAPLLPTRRGGELYEKMGDILLEEGNVTRAYNYYKKIWNYSTHRVMRKDFTERVGEKLKKLKHFYWHVLNRVVLNSIEKASAQEGISFSDRTRYRLVLDLGNFETGEPEFYLEVSFPEKVIRRKIYDYDSVISSKLLTSKKFGPLLVRDWDKLLLVPQTGGSILIFDLNGMLLEKKPVTEEIASRFGIKNIHAPLFAEDDFTLIPKGTFQMGSPPEEGRDNGETLHTVTLTKDFYLQRTEVTQLQWYLVMGEAPSYFKERKYCEKDWDEELEICPNHPVEKVSWGQVAAFIQKLNEMQTEYIYRLPTEAEWEYAARVNWISEGERRKFLTADGFLDIRDSGWAKTKDGFGNSEDRQQTHSVLDRRIKSIEKLYHMHGNVWEWVSDCYDSDYGLTANQLKQIVENPQGPLGGCYRVFRGGGWYDPPLHLRSGHCGFNSPTDRSSYIGFRVLRTKKE